MIDVLWEIVTYVAGQLRSLHFIVLVPSCPCAGGSVKQKKTQSTSVRISSPEIGKGKEKRDFSGKKDPWDVPTLCCLSLCADISLVRFQLGCVFGRGKQHGQLTACPLGATLPCVGLCQGCLAQLLGPGALAVWKQVRVLHCILPFHSCQLLKVSFYLLLLCCLAAE